MLAVCASIIMTGKFSCYAVAGRELLRPPSPLCIPFRPRTMKLHRTAAVNNRNDDALGVALFYRTPPHAPQLQPRRASDVKRRSQAPVRIDRFDKRIGAGDPDDCFSRALLAMASDDDVKTSDLASASI
jgi:hypothetical protein